LHRAVAEQRPHLVAARQIERQIERLPEAGDREERGVRRARAQGDAARLLPGRRGTPSGQLQRAQQVALPQQLQPFQRRAEEGRPGERGGSGILVLADPGPASDARRDQARRDEILIGRDDGRTIDL
jgi:hypothetical protein